MFLGKAKLNVIKFLICKTLIASYISHNEFVSVNNVLREYHETQGETRNTETSVEYTI